jgi:hypothetical protein
MQDIDVMTQDGPSKESAAEHYSEELSCTVQVFMQIVE